MTQDREIWGDPYIGLRWAAESVQVFQDIAFDTPRFCWDAGHTTLGSPDIWEDIANFFRGILDFFASPAGWVLGVAYPWIVGALATIQAYLYDIGDIITAVWNNVWDYVFGPESWLQATVYPWLQGKLAILQTVLYDIRNDIADLWNNAWAFVFGPESWLQRSAVPWVLDKLATISTFIYDLGDIITSVWNNAWNYVFGPESWLQQSAIPWILEKLATISTFIYDLGDIITSVWNNAWNYVFGPESWLQQSAIPWILEKLATISTFIYDLGDIIGAVWNNIWTYVFDIDADKLDATLDTFEGMVLGWYEDFTALPEKFLTYVAEEAGTDLALEPSRALATAGSLYAMAITAGTAAHVTATALNAIPTLNWVGASQLSAFVAQVAGFDEITKATYGTLLDGALSWPMRYHWNQLLRPKIPTEGAIYATGRKRGINRAEFNQAMAYHGLPQWWIDKEYGFFWADPSPYWLLRMSEHATPTMQPSATMLGWLAEWLPNWRSDPWAWYRMKLMLAGFEDTDIQPFIDGFARRRLGPAVTRLKTAIRHMSREAYWDDREVTDNLRSLGVRQEEITYLLQAERIQRQNDYLDDQVRYYNESFRKGEISAQGLSIVLSTIIVKPEVVAQIVAREEVRALPKPKAIVPAAEDPRVKSLVTQAVNSWTKGYRAWELEEEELEVGLTIVLQDPTLALQMVLVERTRYRPEPPPPKPPVEDPLIRKSRVAAIASWVSQFREAKITADTMELGLAGLILDPAIVKLIRQIEELRAVPAPDILPPWEEDPLVAAVREETVRGHIEMFRKRLIDIDELYTYLLADGLAESLARSTALTQALKRIKTPPLESPYFQKDRLRELIDEAIASYTRMLELGQITMDEFEAYLAATGVDPDVITYLGDTQEVRQFILLEGMA